MLYPIHPKRSQEDVRKFIYKEKIDISNNIYENCLCVRNDNTISLPGDILLTDDNINEYVEMLLLYHNTTKTDFSNYPNLKVLYLFNNRLDTITGIEQISELYLVSTVVRNLPYYQNLDYFYMHAYQNGYFNFVDMYHAIRGDLNVYNKLDNIKQVKHWDDVYLNYYHSDNWHIEVATDTSRLLTGRL